VKTLPPALKLLIESRGPHDSQGCRRNRGRKKWSGPANQELRSVHPRRRHRPHQQDRSGNQNAKPGSQQWPFPVGRIDRHSRRGLHLPPWPDRQRSAPSRHTRRPTRSMPDTRPGTAPGPSVPPEEKSSAIGATSRSLGFPAQSRSRIVSFHGLAAATQMA
jgi:hypothetical protein